MTSAHLSENTSLVLPPYLRGAALLGFNNRDNPYMFRDTLIRLVESNTLPYRNLVA